MSVDDALRSTVDVLRQRTGSLLPYYAVLAATVDVARLPLLVGVVVATLALASTGRLDPLADDLAALNPELLSPDSPTGVPPEVSERLAAVLFSPAVVVPLVLAVLAAVVVYVLARGVARASTFAALEAGLSDHDPLAAGVDGTRRWKTFAGLVVIRWSLVLVAGIPLVAAVVGGVATFGTTPDAAAFDQQAVVAVLATLVGAFVTLVALVVVFALLAFAGPVVVVDNVGVRNAIERSAGVPFGHPVAFLLYGVVVVGSYVVLGVSGMVFGLVGIDRVVPVVSSFLVAPLLDGIAVALYAGWRESDEPAASGERDESSASGERDESPASGERDELSASSDVERVDRTTLADASGFVFGDSGVDAESAGSQNGTDSRWTDADDGSDFEDASGGGSITGAGKTAVSALRGAVRDGVRELVSFLREDWRYVVISGVTLVVGILGGWTATAGSGVRIETPADPGSVFGAVPIGPFVNISINNWFVATSAGFSGLFAGVPTVGTLLFNGVLVGAVAGVVDPVAFVAFVGPHGIVELPAIAIAGGVGLRLGHVAWGTWRGTRSRDALADELGRTWRLVVGLAVVFVVAGFVEAFVTPQIAAAVLG